MIGIGRGVATAALVVLGASGASAQVRYQPYAPVAPTPYGYPVPYGYVQPDETLGTSPSFVVNPMPMGVSPSSRSRVGANILMAGTSPTSTETSTVSRPESITRAQRPPASVPPTDLDLGPRAMLLKTLALSGLIAATVVGLSDPASARVVHRHYRHYGYRHGGGGHAAGAAVAGAALGLLGAGIAGAAAADNGYGYGYPAYGSGNPGYGYYGPGYGYYGY